MNIEGRAGVLGKGWAGVVFLHIQPWECPLILHLSSQLVPRVPIIYEWEVISSENCWSRQQAMCLCYKNLSPKMMSGLDFRIPKNNLSKNLRPCPTWGT